MSRLYLRSSTVIFKDMKATLTLLFLAGCNCGPDRLIHKSKCDEPCYGGEQNLAGIGACHMGVTVCKADGTASCENWGSPSPEICDNIDNDCNGSADDIPAVVCQSKCGYGEAICASGVLVCNAPDPKPETCNGLDDDCDGIIDNIPVKNCYTGPPGTESFGDCHAGTIHCVGNSELCVGEKTPTPEVCDNIDNDCNSFVDDGLLPKPTDVVILISTPKTMESVSVSVLTPAVKSWAAAHPNNRYALVQVQDTNYDDGGLPALPILVTNFTDYTTFNNALDALTFGPLYGYGDCGTLDGFYFAVEIPPTIANPFQLSWDPNHNKLVVSFSNEEFQSFWGFYSPNSGSIGISEVVTMDAYTKVPVIIFADSGNGPSYAPIANATPEGRLILLGGQEGGGLPLATVRGIEQSLEEASKSVFCK